jgi:energy-coupling factor transport system permease protein
MAVDFYLPGKSLLHRFDPRAKLAVLVVAAACFFLPFRIEVPLVYVAGLALLVAACLGVKELLKALLAIAPLIVVVAVLTPFLTRTGPVLWRPFGVPILTLDGLFQTARLLLRFTGITLAFFAVFRTIEVNDFVGSLRWFGLPFSASLVIVIALRFIPSLIDAYRSIQDAHELRSHGKMRFFDRLLPRLTSIVIFAVKRMPTLAMVLESRGFGRRERRTDFRGMRSGVGLAVHLFAAVTISLALLTPLVLPL